MGKGAGFWDEGPAEWLRGVCVFRVQGGEAIGQRAGSPHSPWPAKCPVSMSTAPMSQPEDLWSLLFQKLHLSEDVAGATFMAAGSSTPELFASVIGKKPYQPRTHDLERAQAWCPDLRRRLSALSLHVLISEMGSQRDRKCVRSSPGQNREGAGWGSGQG